MKTADVKFMIIENYIDHYTTNEAEREAMKDDAFTYVEEDHVDEISQSFPETAKPNGFRNWIEVFYEVVDYLATTCDSPNTMSHDAREQGGRTAQYSLAEDLTDKFEAKYASKYANGWADTDFFNTIDSFLTDEEVAHLESKMP